MSWKDDGQLQNDLEKFVRQNMKRVEILDFIRRDYNHHFQNELSIRTLDKMLKYFNVRYIDYNVSTDTIRECIRRELEGPGQKLGYRALTTKIRQEHCLKVPRDIVYADMTEMDQEGLKSREPCFKRKKRKGHIISDGVNSVFSMDGHDKLMGYQNSTFPIAIYGILDQASRKILLLKCWSSNRNPLQVGKWYAEWLLQNRILARSIRLDRGSETGKLASIHAYLRSKNGDLAEPTDSIFYGPSTSNQIERWWRELHERLEKFFKEGLKSLLSNSFYDPNNNQDRDILSFIMVPLIQRELDVFRQSVWNPHRIRAQKNANLPSGIPNHIYEFPEQYGLKECGLNVRKCDIDDAIVFSRVNDADEDYITDAFRQVCERLVPHPEEIPSTNFVTAYRYLKDGITNNT